MYCCVALIPPSPLMMSLSPLLLMATICAADGTTSFLTHAYQQSEIIISSVFLSCLPVDRGELQLEMHHASDSCRTWKVTSCVKVQEVYQTQFWHVFSWESKLLWNDYTLCCSRVFGGLFFAKLIAVLQCISSHLFHQLLGFLIQELSEFLNASMFSSVFSSFLPFSFS